MDLNMMLPMLMGMMGKNKTDGENKGMDIEAMTKLMSGMQGNDPSALLSMLSQNGNAQGSPDMMKMLPALMSMMGKGNQNTTTTQSTSCDIPQNANFNSQQSAPPQKQSSCSLDNPFQAVNGFCGNEVNSALHKLFDNK